MSKNKYDIFISYRREGGAQYARNLQLMLEKRGYKVFLDYDELVDSKFSPQIKSAIHNSSIYMILLSKGSMVRCVNEGDWVRREIEQAISENKKIIPVNPDNTFDGIPDDVPDSIKEAIGGTQYSEINFGQALNATVDFMVKNRVRPYISPRRFKIWYLVAALVVLVAAALFCWRWKSGHDIEFLKESITFSGASIEWASDITKEQLLAVQEILASMQPMEGGAFMQGATPMDDGTYHDNVEPEFETPAFSVNVSPFYINKFEVTVGQWNAVMGDDRAGDPNMPVSDVSFTQAKEFAAKLSDLTTMDFRLPSELEWEYAAKGGAEQEGFMFAGSDAPDEVAWYSKNSGGHAHADLADHLPTVDDLFNMSGNVSEWCDTEFTPYDRNQPRFGEGAMVVRGGNYDSEEYETTVTHREPALPDTSLPTLGFRIALSK